MTFRIQTPSLFRLLAALEMYRAEIESLLRSVFRPDSARRLAQALARIGSASGAVPSLAADVAEIALHHRRLMAALRNGIAACHPDMIRRLDRFGRACESAVCAAREKCTNLLLA